MSITPLQYAAPIPPTKGPPWCDSCVGLVPATHFVQRGRSAVPICAFCLARDHTRSKTMKPEAQRIAIATVCRFVEIRQSNPYECSDDIRIDLCGIDKGGVTRALPNYPACLNACHEMEKVFDVNQLSEYADWMDKVCVPVHICPLTHWQAVTMATAPQRCEAFLRTLNLWKDE